MKLEILGYTRYYVEEDKLVCEMKDHNKSINMKTKETQCMCLGENK